jgi:hypothetical protein
MTRVPTVPRPTSTGDQRQQRHSGQRQQQLGELRHRRKRQLYIGRSHDGQQRQVDGLPEPVHLQSLRQHRTGHHHDDQRDEHGDAELAAQRRTDGAAHHGERTAAPPVPHYPLGRDGLAHRAPGRLGQHQVRRLRLRRRRFGRQDLHLLGAVDGGQRADDRRFRYVRPAGHVQRAAGVPEVRRRDLAEGRGHERRRRHRGVGHHR